MNLLKINDLSEESSGIEQHFDDLTVCSIEDLAPRVEENRSGLKIEGKNIQNFDAVYARIHEKNAAFGRILLEVIEEERISLNYSSTAFFTMSKKNYLYSVLHEKNVPTPKTAVISDEKSARNIENYLAGPLIARKFEQSREAERKKIDTVEDISDFTDGTEYGKNLAIFQEYTEGSKYRCLVAGDKIISLEDVSNNWYLGDQNLQYSNAPNNIQNLVFEAKKSLGFNMAEVLIRGEEVVDINPNPDLDLYSNISGKDVYKAVADTLKQSKEEGKE